ncbi:carboxypeptidase-like regulatory domain-containing protein [Hyunsoonleella sp. SJ7]|uniref:Carboxypeptidase-like regulatory domain-containing protein n=1 Tax=Hyunsoonleella aquatilis TaxID=2762758 RepID=A0A923KGG7_9FLAO|nr:TonB-dependent receptor [Hyunsoonleella aquatilis]MBC3758286.1 carboxypeptidase-like regulatory domain-containing protein [Hyunsoonleella aquatilis]
MKKTTNLLILVTVLLFATVAMAQSTIKGTVIDADLNTPLPGANVIEKGTTNGVSSDFDGNFTLNSENNSGSIVVTYVGYGSVTISFNGDANLGKIELSPDNSLGEIVITGTGVIDLAEDRNTPIAVSTIKAKEIRERAGNWDLPEVLKSTPSVQNIKGGGFGDGSMFLRGFDQTNTAFMLNGQPINSPEDGRMFWSNWAGVLDVANAVQVQRGLGSSKLAISSVGGTVNIVTKTVDRKEGGFFQTMVGNDDYIKTNAYYSTGLLESGWAFSAMLGHWQGDGYVEDTDGQGQTYFLSLGYKPSDKHLFNFLLTGAPQWHAAAGRDRISAFLENGIKYNPWNFEGVNSPNNLKSGRYPGGRNIYHKPVANLSWDFAINDKSSLSTIIYGSIGRGSFAQARTSGGEVTYARGSNNNHNWYGVVSNYENQLSESLSLNFGIDVRLYNGIHFRDVREFISVNSVSANSAFNGGDYELTNAFGGVNPWNVTFNPNDGHGQRFGYDYEEQINYGGVFGQLEYTKNNFSAFFQGSASSQSHVRTEYLNAANEGQSEESEKVNNPGFNVKAGTAYTIADQHKVFANVGFYSRQPFHSDLFVSDRNSNELIVPEVENQEITGIEAGYQFGGNRVSANLNVYHTTWANRTLLNNNGQDQGTSEFRLFQTQGVTQVHQGIELEVFTRPFDGLRVNGFISFGDWKFDGNGRRRVFDEAGNEVEAETEVDLDGLQVGGAAQTTGGLSAFYTICKSLNLDATWNFYSGLFSQGDASKDAPPIELPEYDTVDLGLTYRMLVGENKEKSIVFRANVNNIFQEIYLESVNGNTAASSDPAENYKGVNVNNNGRFGYGRTWNVSARFNF